MDPASNFVEGVDLAFKVIFGISIFFLVGITAVMIYFVIRYRKSKHPKAIQFKDNNILEVTWTVIPLLLVLLMFYYGYIAFAPQRNVPKDAIPIKVISKMWTWSFEYEGGKESNVLVVPLDKPVKLILTSLDVIHSLYIPAFRIKEDCVPGKENYMWFIGQREGEYDILCTEYCGLRHSYMEARTKVVPEAEYQKWLKALPNKADEPAGLTVIKKNACTGCHSLDGSKLVSTSFKGLYGKTVTVITDGKERQVKVDDAYLKVSIYEPDKDLAKGLPKGVMKSYKTLITEDDLNKVIDYIKTLK